MKRAKQIQDVYRWVGKALFVVKLFLSFRFHLCTFNIFPTLKLVEKANFEPPIQMKLVFFPSLIYWPGERNFPLVIYFSRL